MQPSKYWSDVHQEMRVIETEIAKTECQPRGGTVFITSLRVRSGDPNMRAGVVTEAAVKLAAQRLVESSHRLSTDEEIRAHLAHMAEERKAVEASLARSRGTMIFTQPKPAQEANRG